MNDRGVLLLHGFTATPECLDSLRAPLVEAGFEVEAPLLAGHGTKVSDLRHTTWRDWYESVLPAYHSLKKRTDAVCVAGLSLGGLLALKIAEEFKVQRLALLATPVLFKGFLMNRVLPFVANSALHHLYPYQPKLLGPAINDPKGRRAFRCYSWMPVEAIMQIVRLQEEVRPGLSAIKAPTVILHSPKDNTAPFESVAFLENRLGSKTIRVVKLEKSNHVLTMDYEKDRVASEVLRFFEA